MMLVRRAVLKAALGSLMVSLVGCSNEDAPSSATTTNPPPAVDAGSGGVYDAYVTPEHTDAARIIAQRYLEIVAPNSSLDDIRTLVAPTVALATADPDITVSVTALRAQVLADFAAGQATNVDGWQLSRTELQLCVLATMPQLTAD